MISNAEMVTVGLDCAGGHARVVVQAERRGPARILMLVPHAPGVKAHFSESGIEPAMR